MIIKKVIGRVVALVTIHSFRSSTPLKHLLKPHTKFPKTTYNPIVAFKEFQHGFLRADFYVINLYLKFLISVFIVLINSESFVSHSSLVLAHTLFVELKKERVNLELLSYIQADRHIVEHFAAYFLSCLARIINDYNFDIIGLEKSGKELHKEYGFRYSNERYSKYIAQLSTVADLVILIATHFNLLTPQELLQL